MLFGRAIRKLGPAGAAVIALHVAGAAQEHWKSIPRKDRARFQSLLRESRGRPSNLSRAQRRELGELVRALQLPALVRSSVLTAAGIQRRLRSPLD